MGPSGCDWSHIIVRAGGKHTKRTHRAYIIIRAGGIASLPMSCSPRSRSCSSKARSAVINQSSTAWSGLHLASGRSGQLLSSIPSPGVAGTGVGPGCIRAHIRAGVYTPKGHIAHIWLGAGVYQNARQHHKHEIESLFTRDQIRKGGIHFHGKYGYIRAKDHVRIRVRARVAIGTSIQEAGHSGACTAHRCRLTRRYWLVEVRGHRDRALARATAKESSAR